MSTIFVLLIIIEGYRSTFPVVQEFTSYQKCEDARKLIVAAHDSQRLNIRYQGCHPK